MKQQPYSVVRVLGEDLMTVVEEGIERVQDASKLMYEVAQKNPGQEYAVAQWKLWMTVTVHPEKD